MSMFDGSMNWLHPLADTSLGDYVFFRLINNYLSNQIDTFGIEPPRFPRRLFGLSQAATAAV
uniref:hypothetical protein n=1 Tax=Xanthomonas albilineans TaxID=29447 RepID=UPI0027DB4318|nr:hypothetical protein [Xanthomonas albilineans]